MPTIITRGAGSAQGLGYAAKSTDANFIEDVFSTYLYTGNGSTQTITTGVDTGTKGGLIWVKKRSAADDHALFDSVRASGSILSSNLTDAATAGGSRLALTSTGFDLQSGGGTYNQTSATYASWTFRKQPKFFDVVTYTGNGVFGRVLSHNLGSVPGCVMIKTTSMSQNWLVYHRSLAGGIQTANPSQVMFLNTTAAAANQGNGPTNATATSITLSDNWENSNGVSYVMYLFAHDAGGFGLTGTDNVISCGSFTTDGSGNATVSLGYEPQWFLRKETSSANDWVIFDNMRGWSLTNDAFLYPNSSSAEISADRGNPTATGFTLTGQNASASFIYIAIRRGPMKVPTSGTSVFSPIARNGTGAEVNNGSPILTDGSLTGWRNETAQSKFVSTSRLTGGGYLLTTQTNTEQTPPTTFFSTGAFAQQTGFLVGTAGGVNASGYTYVDYAFRRAPGFFDVVCYTGTGVARTVTHNLGVAPELLLVKSRSGTGNWRVWSQYITQTYDTGLRLNSDAAASASGFPLWANSGVPSMTSTTFSLGSSSGGQTNESGTTYVGYLFATAAGVSKVGSYTGTGTTQTINCGFTSGARFVLIKRTDSTGDWYVWDSARGIVAGNDPHISLNTTAAEVTTDDSVDTDSTGFVVNQVAATNVNVTSASYIFLAIA